MENENLLYSTINEGNLLNKILTGDMTWGICKYFILNKETIVPICLTYEFIYKKAVYCDIRKLIRYIKNNMWE